MVTIDAGITLVWPMIVCTSVPRTMFNYPPRGLAWVCVGLGTKLGRQPPCRELAGRRGFLYTSQELNTAVRWGIPLVSIVLNNGCHGAEKAQQQRFYDGRYIGVDLVNPRFDKLAEVYGARGFYVSRPDEIADAVVEALAVDGPSVIEIPVAEYFPLPAPTPARASRH
jgi:acetolactate synthase-1/2/3 large subunit/sulfoacetaldehyde acetyltransferase